MPAGSGNGAYLAALRRVVVPALAEFAPEVIVVACGFDAGAYDPLGRMLVTVDGFREMTSVLMEAASTICGGRLVMSHEGGYSAVYVPYCGLGVIETMAGVATGFGDPLAVELNSLPDQRVQPHQELVIQRAADLSALRP